MSDFIGSGERVDGPDGLRIFFRSLRPAEKPRAVSIDKTLKFYEGNLHDLLNDLDRDHVMQDIQAWINARLPATLGTQARARGAHL